MFIVASWDVQQNYMKIYTNKSNQPRGRYIPYGREGVREGSVLSQGIIRKDTGQRKFLTININMVICITWER